MIKKDRAGNFRPFFIGVLFCDSFCQEILMFLRDERADGKAKNQLLTFCQQLGKLISDCYFRQSFTKTRLRSASFGEAIREKK